MAEPTVRLRKKKRGATVTVTVAPWKVILHFDRHLGFVPSPAYPDAVTIRRTDRQQVGARDIARVPMARILAAAQARIGYRGAARRRQVQRALRRPGAAVTVKEQGKIAKRAQQMQEDKIRGWGRILAEEYDTTPSNIYVIRHRMKGEPR